MARGKVTFGNADEAGEAGLGGEQVVVALIEGVLGDSISDRQQLVFGVHEKREVHLRRQVGCPLCQGGKTGGEMFPVRLLVECLEVVDVALHRRQQGFGRNRQFLSNLPGGKGAGDVGHGFGFGEDLGQGRRPGGFPAAQRGEELS